MDSSEEQSRLRELARSFAREEVAPAAAEHDRAATFPHELVEKARSMGLANILAPERYGGEGLGPVELCVVSEELSWGCVGIAGAILLNNLAADCLLAAGTEEQKENYLTRLCAPEGFAVLRRHRARRRLRRRGHNDACREACGGWLLNGQKMWTGNATQAGFMVVFAKTDPGAGSRGISAFLVDSDLPGVEVVREIPKLGQKAYSSCEVEFRDVELPQDALLGRENEGFLVAMKVFDRSRPMVAAFGVGLAQRALDEALAFATEREAFGRPIVEFQGTGFKLAEMGMKVEAARLLTQKAAGLAGRGERNTLEAAYAKAFAADTAMWAAVEAVQVFGGRGYSEDHAAAKLFRDAKAIQVYEGTAEIQRTIMVRELTKKAKAGAQARANEEVAR
jgi:acyl-CoA dehydrogenase